LSPERRRWEWLVLPAAAGAFSLLFSWQRWINPFVDGGRELSVPARLASGERLYRDVVYYYGPAGPWVNAAAIEIFGRRFLVLESVGLLLAGLLLSSLYRLTARAGSPLSAGVATTLAAAICIGAPNGGAFAFPYSFDALFALSGAFLSLASAARGSRAGGAAGLALALASKPEVGAAAALVLLVSILRRSGPVVQTRRALSLLFWGILAAAGAWGLAVAGLPREALFPQGPLALFAPPAEWRRVYAVISGLGDPTGSLRSVATALFLGILVLLGAAAVSALAARRPGIARSAGWIWIAAVVAATVFFCTGSGAAIEDRLPPLLAPMPLVAAAAALLQLRAPLDETRRARFLLFGFSACVASRVILGLTYGAVTTPYSVFALPGLAAVAAVLLLDLLPGRLPHPGAFRRAVAAVFLALSAVALARLARFYPPERSLRVQTSAGTLRLSTEKAAVLDVALRYLEARARPGERLVGFPEAGFFHFVTGLTNPLRQDQVLPGHLDPRGETEAARKILETQPRLVLLVNQAAPAFGQVAFGRDYAVRLWEAVERSYRLAASFGDAPPNAPVGDPRFFIRIYERLSASRGGIPAR
jgi:4-amino-4-deoxy-L-arabinose transferase-like glycosyltransferase